MKQFSKEDKLDGLNVLLISGDGCASCISMYEVVSEVSTKFPNVNFYYLEVSEENLDFLNNIGVRTIPTVCIIKDNKVIEMCHGYQPDEILEIWIESKING